MVHAMPELPEVETMARDLDVLTAGTTVRALLVAHEPMVRPGPEEFAKIILNKKIERVGRLGKWIRFRLSSGAEMFVHPRMTGQFVRGEWPGTLDGPWPPHARVAFKLSGDGGDLTVFYRDIRKFGRVLAFEQKDVAAFTESLGLGPDPLETSREQFLEILAARKNKLKSVLLDQRVLAGLGNIYADESLFAAKIHPLRPASDLAPREAGTLLKEIVRILELAIQNRGSTVSNYQSLSEPGGYQLNHQVYGKAGRPCPVCGGTLLRTVVSGRSTVYCPGCQPAGDKEREARDREALALAAKSAKTEEKTPKAPRARQDRPAATAPEASRTPKPPADAETSKTPKSRGAAKAPGTMKKVPGR